MRKIGNLILFEKRISAPAKNNPFYCSDDNKFHRYGYGLPNCTCYAHGRFAEATSKVGTVWLPFLRNACTWWDEALKRESEGINKGYYTSLTPAVGAIACWKSVTPKGEVGAGHVAFVEEVIRHDNELVIHCSNSAYKGTPFYESYHSSLEGFHWKSAKTGNKYTFQGFICPYPCFNEFLKCKYVTSELCLRDSPFPVNNVIMKLHKGDKVWEDIEMENGRITWAHVCTINSEGKLIEGYCRTHRLK